MAQHESAYWKTKPTSAISKILIVDDDELLRGMLRLALIMLGHEVTDVAQGESAVSPFEDSPADLVLMDQSGLEIIDRLRTRHPPVKIIAMTGGGHDFPARAKLKGAHRVMMKPFSLQVLEAAVNALLAPPPAPGRTMSDEAGSQ